MTLHLGHLAHSLWTNQLIKQPVQIQAIPQQPQRNVFTER
jgi:hypothetical protein